MLCKKCPGMYKEKQTKTGEVGDILSKTFEREEQFERKLKSERQKMGNQKRRQQNRDNKR
jgi:hypothetical protein